MLDEDTEGHKTTIEELLDGGAGPSSAKEDATESLPHTLGVMAAEYGARLRRQIEDTLNQKEPNPPPTHDPISREFDAVAADIQETVTRVQTRLVKMMQQELRRVFEESLSGAPRPAPAPSKSRPTVDQRPSAAPAPILEEAPPAPQPFTEIAPEDLQPSPPRAEESPAPVVEQVEREAPAPPAHLLALRPTVVSPGSKKAAPKKAVAPPHAQPDEDETYEGTVRLTVESSGSIRQVVNFVDRLAQDPHFRLLKAVGNHRKAGMDVWLGLRETLCLRKVLQQMHGVAQVDVPAGYTPDGRERLVRVRLAEVAMAGQP